MRLLVSGHEVNSRIFFCRCKVKTNKRNYAMRWLRRSGFVWKHWSGLQNKDNVTLVKRHEKENRTKDAGKTTSESVFVFSLRLIIVNQSTSQTKRKMPEKTASSQCSSFPYDVSLLPDDLRPEELVFRVAQTLDHLAQGKAQDDTVR